MDVLVWANTNRLTAMQSNVLKSICSLVHSAYSDKGRIIARAKQEGVLDRQTVTGKKATASNAGTVTLTEKLKAVGCTEAEKRAIDIAKAADLLIGSIGQAHWPKSSDVPSNESDDLLISKIEMLRASNETLESQIATAQARIAELEAALASAPTPAKSAKSAKSANGTKTSA